MVFALYTAINTTSRISVWTPEHWSMSTAALWVQMDWQRNRSSWCGPPSNTGSSGISTSSGGCDSVCPFVHSSSRCLLFLGLRSPRFLFLEFCPPAFYPVPSQPGLRKSIFCRCRASTMNDETSSAPCRPLTPPGCHSLVFCSWRHCSLGFVSAVLDTPGPLPSQVRSCRPSGDLDYPRGVLQPTGLGHFLGTKFPSGNPKVMLQRLVQPE